ncbi:MAG: ATP-binding protein [Terrimicrobiaceae bacterium]|nr:ATP-binding protein [Terrimicrobiaceae bacterium]
MKSESVPAHIDLLPAVADALSMLLEPGRFEDSVPRVLARIGVAAKVDRVYFFENHGDGDRLLCSQRFEWVREGISPQLANPSLQNMSYADVLPELFEAISKGRVFKGLVREIAEPMRASLEEQAILALAVVPVHVAGTFRGFIGFDDCTTERQWADTELDALRAVAAGLGGALVRARSETALEVRADELVKSRRVALSLMEDAQKAVREAEKANRAKSAFLAMMSHEIRTPLNGVIGFTDLLLSEPLSDEQREWVSTIRNCGDALLALISDILDLSRVESGRMEFEQLAFNPADCLRDVVASFAALVRSKGLTLDTRVEDDVPAAVIADPARLRQVLFNLLGNAVKFTEKGRVSVSLNYHSFNGNKGELVCAISDSGIGMSPAEVRSIFEAFGQAHSAIHRQYGGSGLGLAICRSLLEAMGGSISVRSAPGEGSTFTFRLPVRPGQSAPIPSIGHPTPRIEGPGVPLRVLAVDDVPANLQLVSRLLKRLGCEAVTAGDGDDAVECWRSGGFDVVLMDVLMPRRDGIEATREIRRIEAGHPGRSRTWIIALTADAFEENRRRCLAAGMDDFLTKPLRLDTLHAAIERRAASAR